MSNVDFKLCNHVNLFDGGIRFSVFLKCEWVKFETFSRWQYFENNPKVKRNIKLFVEIFENR